MNEVEVFLSIGRLAGVRPGDIVGAIANDTGIPGNDIGKVSVFDHKTFVGLSRENAERLIEEHPALDVRGKSIRLKIARPRPAEGRHGFGESFKSKKKGGKRPYQGKKRSSPGGDRKGPSAYKGKRKGPRNKG